MNSRSVFCFWHLLNPIMDNAHHMLIFDIFQLQMYWFDLLKPNTLILSCTKYIYTLTYMHYILCLWYPNIRLWLQMKGCNSPSSHKHNHSWHCRNLWLLPLILMASFSSVVFCLPAILKNKYILVIFESLVFLVFTPFCSLDVLIPLLFWYVDLGWKFSIIASCVVMYE